jgi:hypothetical protein
MTPNGHVPWVRSKVLGCQSDWYVLTGRGNVRRREFIAGATATGALAVARSAYVADEVIE